MRTVGRGEETEGCGNWMRGGGTGNRDGSDLVPEQTTVHRPVHSEISDVLEIIVWTRFSLYWMYLKGSQGP